MNKAFPSYSVTQIEYDMESEIKLVLEVRLSEKL